MGSSASILGNDASKLIGLSFDVFEDFIHRCGGRESLAGLTTTDVCVKYVLPMTLEKKSSYCDKLISSSSNPKDAEGKLSHATVFVSHAWKYLFLDTWDAISRHLNRDGEEKKVHYIWFDLFCNNQHEAVTLPFEWWCSTFKNAISSVGRTVVVLSPWDNPIPFTRAWCLWEIYCSLETKSELELAMSSEEEARFLQMINQDYSVYDNMLSQIDIEQSESYYQADRDKIFEVVRSTVGFHTVNCKVMEEMRVLVLTVMKQDLAKVKDTDINGRLQKMSSLARMYFTQGKYEESLSLFQECVEFCRKVAGEEHPNTLALMNNLANMYSDLGRYAEALPLYERCLQIHKREHGEEHLNTLNCMDNLALVYGELGQRAKSLEQFEKTFAVKMKIFGAEHSDTLESMNNLASAYRDMQEFAKALGLSEQCYRIRKEQFGDKHPTTLTAQNNLANVYCDMKQFSDAEPLFLACLESNRRCYGDEHPNTIHSMNSLAVLRTKQGQMQEALDLLKECLELRKRVLGEGHPDTLESMHSFGCLLYSTNQSDDALMTLDYCVRAMTQVLGANHPSTLRAKASLNSLMNA